MKASVCVDLQCVTRNTSSNFDGDILCDFLFKNAINDQVVINIHGDFILSTSFLNSSFGKFIDNYGIELFKKNIKIKTNLNTFKRLKDYVNVYSQLYHFHG